MGMTEKYYWLHRISHCYDVSKILLDKGYISIGFSEFLKNEKFYRQMVDKNIDDKKKWSLFEEENKNIWKELRRTRYNLWRFLTEFYADDIVIIPSWGTFSIYKVVSEAQIAGSVVQDEFCDMNNKKVVSDGTYLYYDTIDSKNVIDLGFVVKVEPIVVDVSRYDYADTELSIWLKFRATNADLTSLKDNIENVITNAKSNTPINIYADATESMAKCLLEVLQNKLIPDKFEYLVKWYFENIGASFAKVCPKNPSGKASFEDVDVVAEFKDLKITFYVQAKHHKGITGDWAVKQLEEYQNLKYEKTDEVRYEEYQQSSYWVVSTCDRFSDSAIIKARSCNVRLIDGLEFSRMLINAGIKDINLAFEK